MKRKLAYALITAFILINVFVIYHFINRYQEKETTATLIETLSSFTLSSTIGEEFTHKELQKDRWIVFVFFNSECHYCQSEAEQLKDLKATLKDIQFVWISSESVETIASFQKEYHLEELDFLFDAQDQLAQEWGISATPQFLIYRPEGTLFKNHKGALRMDTLISQIHDTQTP
jgi:peroxiredoxin